MVSFPGRKLALLVHRDITALSAFQHALDSRGYAAVLARDLPTALLAITQHHFEAAIIGAYLGQNGDGFALAGITQRIFPEAQVSVVASNIDVPHLLAAINNGVHNLIDMQSGDAQFLVGSALRQARGAKDSPSR